jgi:preprotein translocase subunit SecE
MATDDDPKKREDEAEDEQSTDEDSSALEDRISAPPAPEPPPTPEPPEPPAEVDVRESSFQDNEAKARSMVTRSTEKVGQSHDGDDEEAIAPTQMGAKRFVYVGYFAGAIGIAFLLTKIVDFAWIKAAQYKPGLGEPTDEAVFPVSGVIGALIAFYYWKRTRARQLAEEVANELSKVTWPSKEEVTNSTTVVIVTTALATVFFALMDRFWGFVTNLVYGT